MALALRVARHFTQKHGCTGYNGISGGSGNGGGSSTNYSTQQQFIRLSRRRLYFTIRLYNRASNEQTQPKESQPTQVAVPPQQSLKKRMLTPRPRKLVYDPKMQWDEKPLIQKTLDTYKGDDDGKPTKKDLQQEIPLQSDDEIKTGEEKGKGGTQNWPGYVFHRYFNYVKNYDKVLEKNFPRAISVYRIFFDGVKEFFADMKRYLQIARIVHNSPEGMRALIRRDLELYRRMPHDMFKVAPALVGCSLPMVGYAFFPLVFMFPRQFLTNHFWTLQQRSEYQQYYLTQRLLQNKPVLRSLQAKLDSLKDHPQHAELKKILGQIGSGTHPSVEQLLAVKEIFATGPLSLKCLTRKQVNQLVKLNDVGVALFKRFRLREHAFIIHLMDLAIMREGHPHNMDHDSLRYSCYLRGLNPANLSKEEMVEWLRQWIAVSMNIKEEHISLFVHLPVLLGYNHPNNWQLIYEKKEPWKNGDSKKK